LGAIVNSSREIIFAYRNKSEGIKFSSEEFALASGSAAQRMREEIERVVKK
jgi:hypothetical protein